MVIKHDANEVELILDDIRDTLSPKRNPDCTFLTRRHDRRIQDRLIDLSAGDDSRTWGDLVYSRDQDLSAVGWQDIVPYPRYVDKRTVLKDPSRRKGLGVTNPVDNSTIVRHLQERIRKWADRKQCLYTRKGYIQRQNTKHPAPSDAPATASHTIIINSLELPGGGGESDGKKRGGEQGGGHSPTNHRLPVSWNLLSQHEATHLNLQTYGMDPNVTYVPARKQTSHISSYAANKHVEQQQRAAAAVPKAPHYGARPGGVLQPAKAPRYPRAPRKQGPSKRVPANDTTVDQTEEGEEALLKYREKFKCSICIEGLQVADWPPNIEYSTGNARATLKVTPQAAQSECLRNYKSDKSSDQQGSSKSTTSLALVTASDTGRAGQGRQPSSGHLYHGSVTGRAVDTGKGSGRTVDLKQLVIKERVRAADRTRNKYVGSPSSSSDRGRGRGSGSRQEASLYDRFQASQHAAAKSKQRYGISICDLYESKTEQQDLLSYGVFLATPLATPPDKQQLDPLMNIRPVNYVSSNART